MGLLDYFFKGGNIGFMARNLTYLHEKLKRDYGESFSDERDIMFVTAYINMSAYIKLGQIDANTIRNAINDLREKVEEYDTPGCLNDFVNRMIKLMCSVDAPQESRVLDSFLLTIIQNVQETKQKMEHNRLKNRRYDKTICQIMKNPQYFSLRQSMGIKESA